MESRDRISSLSSNAQLSSSTTETTPETVTLTQIAPGDATYAGSINTTAAAPAADGQLSVANGDTITVHYVDSDDGNGGTNVPHDSTSTVDCLAPTIQNVLAGMVKETPLPLAVQGTGVTGPIRPDYTGKSVYDAPSGLFLNPAAYAAPAPGKWGNA